MFLVNLYLWPLVCVLELGSKNHQVANQRAQRQSCNTKLNLYIGDVILGWAELNIIAVPDMTIC